MTKSVTQHNLIWNDFLIVDIASTKGNSMQTRRRIDAQTHTYPIDCLDGGQVLRSRLIVMWESWVHSFRMGTKLADPESNPLGIAIDTFVFSPRQKLINKWRQRVISRFLMLAVLSYAAVSGAISVRGMHQQSRMQTFDKDNTDWVAESLKRMQTIKPGMTRTDLLKVFTTEGGLSTGLQRTFVSQDCPYFKVDVEFEAVGRPSRDANGRVTLVEGSQDIIVKISRPYLEFSSLD